MKKPAPWAVAACTVLWLLLRAKFAAGQGLSISPEQLGAGEAAVADQFSKFEEILDLSSQSTGGRGRGGRGGSTTAKTGGTGFRSVKSLQQLQLAMYYLAGSPPAYNSWNTSQNPGGISLLPGVRDQLDCDSCVAQAIAAAIQAAAGAAWRQNADQVRFNVSAASLYYCSEGGKTCKTGWDLQDALASIMDKSQFLIRPTTCTRKVASHMLDDPTSEPQVNDWKPTCQAIMKACSNVSSRALPWLSCSYKSLSSFVDIQRHIRQHGGALTRITIYDDFWNHFNVTRDGGEPKATVSGAAHKAYNRTSDSRSLPLFGHAALIVGYNNTELTWTLLNSYGTQRFTRDGLFKIAMGVAGVAVPDQTFGIQCKPAPGGPSNLHSTDWLTPWISEKQLKPRKPVDYWDRAKDWNNLNASCYRYNITARDTVSSVADAFGVSLQQLVRDNQALLPLQQVNYTLKTGTELADLQRVVAVANQLRLAKGIEPFFVCRIHTGQTWMSSRTCKQSDLAPCAGAWACKIVYSEADVSVPLAPGTALKVCGISRVDEPGGFDRVAFFKEPRDSQPRALRALQEVLDARQLIVQYGSQAACYGLHNSVLDDGYPLYAECDASGHILALELNYWHQNTLKADMLPFTFNDVRTLYALMNLQQLSTLIVGINSGGRLARQLGALNLTKLQVYDYCYPGRYKGQATLPGNWLSSGGSWRSTMTELVITARWDVLYEAASGQCGVTGSLPAKWCQGKESSALKRLDLSRGQLTGSLPEGLPMVMSSLEDLVLARNHIEGTIPASFATFTNLRALVLFENRFSGAVPVGLAPRYISLGDNKQLQGCVPFNPDRQADDAKYANTGITGLCEDDAEARWSRQRAALGSLQAVLGFENSLVHNELNHMLDETVLQTARDFYWQIPDAAAKPGVTYTYVSRRTAPDDSSMLYLEIILLLINGMPGIVGVQVEFREDGKCSPVNTQPLPDLLRQLPHLEVFKVTKTCSSIPSTHYQLPIGLPEAAPTLKVLVLACGGLVGTIPDWMNWTMLQELDLRGNQLSGALPDWRGMASLGFMDLSSNKISGSLLAVWGDVMSPIININLSGNPDISGSIPASWWQRFSRASIDLRGTSLTGCRPEGWQDYTQLPDTLASAPFCVNTEAFALRLLKRLWDNAFDVDDGPDAPLPDCSNWKQFISCNEHDQVVGVSLYWPRSPVNRLGLATLLQALTGFTQLQTLKLGNNPQLFNGSQLPASELWSSWPQLRHLDVSNCGLAGSLPSGLSRLIALAYLNVSNNPGITGTLPKTLAATQLQVLDASGCGLSGPLPMLYAALPLQILRLGARGQPASLASISGPLPAEYGMLVTLRELSIVNSMVTGSIPSAWFDPSAAQAAITAAAAQPVLAEMQAAAEAAAAAHSAASAQPAAIAAEVLARHKAAAAIRIVTAWQRAMQQPASISTGDGVGAAAAQAPAGGGLSMQQLETLVLAGNAALEGTLPPQLSALQKLQVLNVSGDALRGQLPESYGKLSQLQQLDLSRNRLSGAIPALWLGLHSLQLLDLSFNPSLGGAFPEELYLMAQGSHRLACLRLYGTGSSGAGVEWAPDNLSEIKERFAQGSKPVTVAVSRNDEEGSCSQFA